MREPSAKHKRRRIGLFGEDVEREAREVVQSGSADNRWNDGLTNTVASELAVLLETLDAERQVHRQQDRSVMEEEIYVDNELLGVDARTPPYSPYRFPERERLQRRRGILTKERRELRRLHGRREAELRGRLVALMSKFHLMTDDEDDGD